MNDFFANLYELITTQTDLSKLLLDEVTYLPIGIVMLLISAAGMTIYYYVKHSFIRWFQWLIWVVVLCLINFGIAWAMADGVVYDIYGSVEGFVTSIATFATANAIWTFIFSFAISIAIKWGSINGKYTPF